MSHESHSGISVIWVVEGGEASTNTFLPKVFSLLAAELQGQMKNLGRE